jgi:membrane protein implicated in regulation of membrane protease activity
MAESTVWWVLAGVAVGAEMLTGTIYLLMIAVGLAAGALAAHAGLGTSAQLVIAGVVGTAACVAWHFVRGRGATGGPATANRDVNLDVGETVQVDAWNADGTATVRYRGSTWQAVPAPGRTHGANGPHRIVEVSGSRLYIEKL